MKQRLFDYYIFVLMAIGIAGCSEWEEELPPTNRPKVPTLEEYFHFKTETYHKLCEDKEFIRICNLYNQEKNNFSNTTGNYDSLIHLAWNYGETLDYCKNNSLMIYVFKYTDEHFSSPQTKYDIGEVIVEGDYEYLKTAYRYAYYDVMDVEQYVFHTIEPWGGTMNDLYFTIKKYIPTSETDLYFLMKNSGSWVQATDLLPILRKNSIPGNFEFYISQYPQVFARIANWAEIELKHILLQGGSTGSGGGSSSNPPPVPPTPYADALYGATSSLTQQQKTQLNQALKEFVSRCPEYKAMYDKLVSLGVKINFKIDASVFDSSEGLAGYKEKVMYFYDASKIKVEYIQEEMIHAIQEIEIYGITTMENARKNIEFEAKVMQDVLNVKYTMLQATIGSVGQEKEFMDEYGKWIMNYDSNKTEVISRFHEFCATWTGYRGKYASNLQPQLLIKYLND
ncbi:MAG: hypothetical protein ACLTSL_05665 [Odoribacter splanchnicus]